MPWKEELPNQGPAPSSSAQGRPGFSRVEDKLTRVLKEIEMGGGKINATGSVDVSLAPIARFPWEVRVVNNVIRVYKGIAVNAQGSSDVRRSHIKVAGKSKNPVRITDSRAGSPGDFDWAPPPDQRDPYAVPPEGPGTQVAWPPFYVDGAFATTGTNRKDPEPKDGGIPFSTYGAYIGKGGYDNAGADQNPWFEFPYAVGPIYVAGRTSAFGAQEVGVFQGETGIDPTGWKVLIAYVSSPELVHQFFRSDLVMIGSGAASDSDHPWKIQCKLVSGNVVATLSPGHVNNIVPSNMSSSFSLTDNQTNYIYLISEKIGTVYVSQASIGVSTTGVPANDADKSHMLLGYVVVTSGTPQTFVINQTAYTAYNTLRVKYGTGTSDQYYLYNRI